MLHFFSFFYFFWMSVHHRYVLLKLFCRCLSVDLVTLTGLVDIFREQDLQEAERVMDVVEMIHSLTTLYEKLEEDRSILVNIPLCIDMCLNWLLNVYDRWVI